MWCLRRIGGFRWSDFISNEKVLEILKTRRTLLFNIKKRKMKYYGHIKRRGNILTTALMEERKANDQKADLKMPVSLT